MPPWDKYAQQGQVGAVVPPNPVLMAQKGREEARKNEDQIFQRNADQRAAAVAAREAARFAKETAETQTPGDITKSGEDYLATLPGPLAAQVKALADGRRAFPTGSALRSPQVQELVAAATQYDPTLDAANAATRVATRKDFTSGKAAQNITAMNTALGHLGSLSNAAAKLENRSFPLWNTVANMAEQATGDPRVKNFTLARNAVSNELMKVFRGTGGSVSEIEEWQNNIDSSDSPEQLHATITQATDLLRSRLEAMNDQYGRGMGKSGDPIQLLSPHAQQIYNKITTSPGLGLGDDKTPPAYSGGAAGGGPQNGGGGSGGNPPTPWDQPNPSGGMTVATGPTRTIHSDRLSAQVDTMVNAGASKAEIDAVLAQQGFPALDPASFAAAQNWRQKNAGQRYFGASVDREEPLGLLAQAAGSAPGAFTAQMANSATAGIAGALSGDQGQGALDAMSATHPNSALAGSLVGGITGAGALEAGVAARAPAAIAGYAPRIADALYGGMTGYTGAQDGEGLSGAIKGAGLGVAGGALGERSMRVAASLARGVRDPAVDYLRARGVPLTVGQIAGQGGAIGRGVKKIEDALTSIPGVGNVIDARRREGIQGFNQAAFDLGAETTGNQVQDYGAAGLAQLRNAVGDTYDRALGPVRIDATEPQFAQDVGAVVGGIQNIPNVNGAQDAAMTGLRSRIDGAIDPTTDTMSGRGFQEAYRGLARTGRERANGDYGHEIGQSMRQGQDALAGALERQSPGAYREFLNANTGNRRMNVLAQALDAAKNQEDQLFTPAQLNRADAQSATRLTGRVNSASGNRPFAELAQAGQAVLPSKLGDSGTGTRGLVAAALTGALGGGGGGYLADGGEGAATGAGAGIATSLALMLGGSRASQRIAERLLVDRPDLALRVGDALIRNANRGGAIGAGVANPVAAALTGY